LSADELLVDEFLVDELSAGELPLYHWFSFQPIFLGSEFLIENPIPSTYFF
jgi:hypothetical protein